MLKGIIILFLLISLVNCAPKRIPKENLDAINKVAVISLMGDRIQFREGLVGSDLIIDTLL